MTDIRSPLTHSSLREHLRIALLRCCHCCAVMCDGNHQVHVGRVGSNSTGLRTIARIMPPPILMHVVWAGRLDESDTKARAAAIFFTVTPCHNRAAICHLRYNSPWTESHHRLLMLSDGRGSGPSRVGRQGPCAKEAHWPHTGAARFDRWC
jgi:hypothetical protein